MNLLIATAAILVAGPCESAPAKNGGESPWQLTALTTPNAPATALAIDRPS